MYEFRQAAGSSWYIECPAKVGVVRLGGDQVLLIDSGSDKDAGKKVLRVLEQNGLAVHAVVNTHSHADHIGGNRYLQMQTGCPVYAPGIECDFTNHPILEPAMLYGGFPLRELHHKFLLAQGSDAQPLKQAVLPQGMEIIPLPGHSYDMVGLRTADDVVYLADCLSSQETLEKYGVGYLWDVAAYLDTLERVKGMRARCFVPAHAAVTEEIAPLAQINIDAVHAVGETILSLLRSPMGFEDLLRELFAAYGMRMTLQQHMLVGSTLRSYLSWLCGLGQAGYAIEDNRLLFMRK